MDPPPATGRLFVALWPSDSVRRQLVARQAALGCQGTAARLTPPADLHLTLLFIGTVARARLAEVADAVSAVQTPPFELELDAAERWHADLVALTGATVPAPLAFARQALEAALSARDLPFDRRAFKPHVTLARKVPRSVVIAKPAPLLWCGAGHVLAVREGAGYRVLASGASVSGIPAQAPAPPAGQARP